MDVLLAGCVAEEICFGSRSTGAQKDLEQALDLARLLVAGGMSELGIVHQEFLPDGTMHEAIRKILKDRETLVKGLLALRQTKLVKARSVLLERERIDGDEFRSLLGRMTGSRRQVREARPGGREARPGSREARPGGREVQWRKAVKLLARKVVRG